MDASRYQQIKAILIDALDLPRSERDAFVAQACGSDATLRQEVESLLKHESADEFLEPVGGPALIPLSADQSSPGTAVVDPLVGQQVTNYRILERLGAGGMGVVYLAEDLRLGRRTALKFLKEELVSDKAAKARLFREARAGAALDHPNICTLYGMEETESGQTFLAMAYYDGETLKQRLTRGPLPLEQILEISRQIGAGLTAAHAAGIVHRDVKPGNVLLAKNTVKILDFGIAKLRDHATLTLPGAALGTHVYSSPEQAAGAAVDHRTDIWSLGVVIYEMLAGRRPFDVQGSGPRALAARLVPPRRLVDLRREVSEDLETCVFRALSVDAASRYQSMREFVGALETARLQLRSDTSTASTAGVVDSARTPDVASTVAVLPLANRSTTPHERRLGEAITEALIERLSVASRLTVVRCATPPPASDLMSLRHGPMLRLESVQVGEASPGATATVLARVLDDSSDGISSDVESQAPSSDMPRLLNDLARAVMKRLNVRVRSDELRQLSTFEKVDPEAYASYLLGRLDLEQGTPAGCASALRHFERALATTRPVSAARPGIVETCVAMVEQRGRPDADPFVERARLELATALATDPSSVEAQFAAAEIDYRLDWSLDAAESRLRDLLASRPGSVRVRRRLAECLIAAGSAHEAAVLAREAAERDPYSPRTLARAGRVLHFAGQYTDSARMYRAALAILPGAITSRLDLALTLAADNDPGGACIECDRALASLEGQALVVAALGNAVRARGDYHRYQAARRVLDGLESATPIPVVASQLLEASFGSSGIPLEYMARQSGLPGLTQYLGLTPVPGSLSSFVDRVGLVAYLGLDEAFQRLEQATSYRTLTRLLASQ